MITFWHECIRLLANIQINKMVSFVYNDHNPFNGSYNACWMHKIGYFLKCTPKSQERKKNEAQTSRGKPRRKKSLHKWITFMVCASIFVSQNEIRPKRTVSRYNVSVCGSNLYSIIFSFCSRGHTYTHTHTCIDIHSKMVNIDAAVNIVFQFNFVVCESGCAAIVSSNILMHFSSFDVWEGRRRDRKCHFIAVLEMARSILILHVFHVIHLFRWTWWIVTIHGILGHWTIFYRYLCC